MHEHGSDRCHRASGVISLREFRTPDPAHGAVIMKGHYSARQAIEIAQTDATMKVVMTPHGATA